MNNLHERDAVSQPHDQIEYHSARAMRELDLGLIAASIPAARAHLALSSLHFERMRALNGGASHRKPPCGM